MGINLIMVRYDEGQRLKGCDPHTPIAYFFRGFAAHCVGRGVQRQGFVTGTTVMAKLFF